ncbi:MAG: hypothetical protein ACXWTH_00370 [Methylosarcina sp.]
MLIIVIIGMLIMPEDLLHLFAVVAHTLYESIAFAIEELLVHGFGFNKLQAQMIVFYTTFTAGVWGAVVLIRRIPQMVANARERAIQSYIQVRADLINRWIRLPARRKIELILLQSLAVFSMMAMMIS